MINRKLLSIIRDQDPLIMNEDDTVQEACAAMCRKRTGSVLVIDDGRQLGGIFTGRDAVRALSQCCDPAWTLLSCAMTRSPVTITPTSFARADKAICAKRRIKMVCAFQNYQD